MERYIDADKLLKEYRDISEYEFPTASGYLDEFLNREIPNFISQFETEDVAPVVHGEWIEEFSSSCSKYKTYSCSTCRAVVDYKPNYCPYCGTKMDKE